VKAGRGERTLKFRFRGESWVEVRDAQGRIVLSRLNAAGSEAEVAGRPPLTVVVGNAPEVQVLSDDRNFPLEPHTKVAVARFTVE
jgi:cytoskeleton protein RodZ